MHGYRRDLTILLLICCAATLLGLYVAGGIEPEQIQTWLTQAGIWAPVIYILLYVVATLFVMPSTALNLSGGAIFGPWLGTLWTSLAAVIAAVVAFFFTRTIGYDLIARRMAKRWRALDAEIHSGGLFYMFAIRLLPIIPYGLVNFAAGLTSIRFRDYLWGTILGTVPGVLPFVMMGSFGLKALKTGDILPLVGAFSLAGLLVAGATWYRHHRTFRQPKD